MTLTARRKPDGSVWYKNEAGTDMFCLDGAQAVAIMGATRRLLLAEGDVRGLTDDSPDREAGHVAAIRANLMSKP